MNPQRDSTRRIAFIDFEASGLGVKSWPVEIGWAFVEGDPFAHLIAPAETWLDEAWDPAAEKLHGLSREILKSKGDAPAKICEIANKALAGFDVYSDAPDWDGFWLYRLFDAARIKPAFSLSDFGALLQPVGLDRFKSLFAKADAIAPRRHRAADDARHLQTLYRLIAEMRGADMQGR